MGSRLFTPPVGDRPQGVAGDCNSLAETHAWFDSRVAHHFSTIYISNAYANIAWTAALFA